jgi:hypothetical protein
MPARDQMHVSMEHRLTRIRSDVYADIETSHLLVGAPYLSFCAAQDGMNGV